MSDLEEVRVMCPYCGSGFIALIEASIENQHYIEDCRACCSPINFVVSVGCDNQQLYVRTLRDDE